MLLHVGAYFFVFLSFLSHACLVYYFVVFQSVPVECFWEIKCWIWNGFNFVGLSAVCVVWRHMQPSLSWFCGWLKFWAGINIVYEIDGKWTKPSLTNNSKWKLAVHRGIVAKVTLPSTRFTLPLAHWQTIVAGNATTFFDECFRWCFIPLQRRYNSVCYVFILHLEMNGRKKSCLSPNIYGGNFHSFHTSYNNEYGASSRIMTRLFYSPLTWIILLLLLYDEFRDFSE